LTPRRVVERQALIERMPYPLRERVLTTMSISDMAESEKVAASLRVQSLANEIGESMRAFAECGTKCFPAPLAREAPRATRRIEARASCWREGRAAGRLRASPCG